MGKALDDMGESLLTMADIKSNAVVQTEAAQSTTIIQKPVCQKETVSPTKPTKTAECHQALEGTDAVDPEERAKSIDQNNASENLHEEPILDEKDIVMKGECGKMDDGMYLFSHTAVIYRQGPEIYRGRLNRRDWKDKPVRLSEITKINLIPVSAYQPPAPPGVKVAPNPLPENAYVKRPSMAGYDPAAENFDPEGVTRPILQETAAMEVIGKHTHPNIAQYLGCQIEDGRITGIVYKKYLTSLMALLNPGHTTKKTIQIRSQPHERS